MIVHLTAMADSFGIGFFAEKSRQGTITTAFAGGATLEV